MHNNWSPMAAAVIFVVCFCAGAQAAPQDWLTPKGKPQPATAPRAQTMTSITVPELRRAEAVKLLQSVEILELTEPQFLHLSQEAALTVQGGNKPFLVRGVSPNKGGRCSVDSGDGNLYVFCYGLGNSQYEERPLIVLLPRQPISIWISATTAR